MKKIFWCIALLFLTITFTGCNGTTTGNQNSCKITFADANGSVIETISFKQGDDIDYPEISEEEGYTYSWSMTLDEIKNTESDLFVMAVRTPATKITKYYIDDKIVKEVTTDYFNEVSEPNVPKRYANYNWERHIEKRDDVYYETFSLKYDYATFSITYYDGNEEVDLEPSSFVYGNSVTLPTYEKEGMIFVGWFLSDLSMTRYTEIGGDTEHKVKLYARFVSRTPEALISLGDDYTYEIKSFYDIKSSEYPNAITRNPVIPTGAPQSATSYDWSTEDETIALISEYSSIRGVRVGYTVIKGIYKTDPSIVLKGIIKVTATSIEIATVEEANSRELVEVTFVDTDNTVLYKQTIIKGDHIIPPTPPVHEGKAFNGWDHELYNINEDTTIMATYVDGTNEYAGKKIAIIGDSISTYLNVIPSYFRFFYPYASANIYDFYQCWWMRVINRLGGSLFMNNSYSGSFVADGSSSASTYDGRLAELVINGERPDVIIIFMGTNDIGSRIPTGKYQVEYMIMLKKLKALCPNAEIICCSLPLSLFIDGADDVRLEYLEVVKNCVNDTGSKFVDLTDVDLRKDLIDRVHPTKNGMEMLADKIIEELLS